MEPLTSLATLKPNKAKGVISFAFVFFILLYAIFFHVFSLSLSHLINNTKFWFLISNTLIVIIAADYGVFLSSSSSSNADLREEYPMFRRQRSAFSVRTRFQEENPNIHQTDHYYCHPHHQTHSIDDNLQDKLELTLQKNSHATPEFGQGCYANRGEVAVSGRRRRTLGRELHRSLSEANAKRVVFDESRNIVRTFECKRNEEEEQERAWKCTKADEYSKLSNDELNKRVEDFIKRFNNQIRVQAAVYN